MQTEDKSKPDAMPLSEGILALILATIIVPFAYLSDKGSITAKLILAIMPSLFLVIVTIIFFAPILWKIYSAGQ